MELGVTINPIAFLVITKDNVRLIPVNHTSSIDRLLDYMPDLIEKTNNMMNRCIQNKKEETEKIISKMGKKAKKQHAAYENKQSNSEQKVENDIQHVEKITKKIQKTKDDIPEEIVYEYEYDEIENEDEM